MPLHKKFLINLVALTLALLIGGPSSAILPGGCVKQGEPEQESRGPDYTASGEQASGYLTWQWVPSSWPDEKNASLFENTPVILETYLPYPNPHSTPLVFVAVDESADFLLEIRDSEDKIIDAFVFTEVEPGFYRFSCERMLPAMNPATVALWWDGSEQGRLVVPEKFLMPAN